MYTSLWESFPVLIVYEHGRGLSTVCPARDLHGLEALNSFPDGYGGVRFCSVHAKREKVARRVARRIATPYTLDIFK